MNTHGTLGDLFELSLDSEREAEAFYAGLAARYEAYKDVSARFEALRCDEAYHIEEISALRASLPAAKLNEPVPPKMMVLLKGFLRFSAKDALAGINTLEEAYRLAINLEFSEVNRIHSLLFELYAPSEERRAHASELLDEHLIRVKALPRTL